MTIIIVITINNYNSKLITITIKKLHNFENFIPRTMLHHNKITLTIKYLVMSNIGVITSVVMLRLWIPFGFPSKKWIPFITYAGLPSKKWTN